MNGLAGVEQQRRDDSLRAILAEHADQLQAILRDAVPLVELPGGETAQQRFEYRCQHGDGIIRHCTPQQAKQAQMLGRPVEQRAVSDWVRIPQ